jgi:hypothetical protein
VEKYDLFPYVVERCIFVDFQYSYVAECGKCDYLYVEKVENVIS